jgi:dihydrofolate reductase
MNAYWPTAASDPTATDYMLDYARIWNATPKIVFSTSLTRVEGNSRLVSGDVGEVLTELRAEFHGELSVGGPTLAAEFIRRGLIDEYRVVVHPVVLGAGLPFFPGLETPVGLRLTETRQFASGAMYLGYVRV